MARKKGIIPSHVIQQKKTFIHPREDHPMITIFRRVEEEDPRKPSLTFQYSLTSVLFMLLISIMCGAKDLEQIVTASKGMSGWLGNYVDMTSGVPCERTFKNILSALKPEALEKALRELSSLIREKIQGDVLSFDGQSSNGTADKQKGLRGIHLLNVWSTENSICLGQLKIDDKSNEIPAMPQLMELLDIRGCVITADALNTQTSTVEKARDLEADYVLPIKGNQEATYNEIVLAFSGLDKDLARVQQQQEFALKKAVENRNYEKVKKLTENPPSVSGHKTWISEPEKGHGRIEVRRCDILPAGKLPCSDRWRDLKTIIRISRKKTDHGETKEEVVYYISSLPTEDPQNLARIVRAHWRVENLLHWRLDVHFGQDDARYRDRIGAANLAALRKMALNALSKEKSLKKGVATKQCAAAFNPEYREKVLKNLF